MSGKVEEYEEERKYHFEMSRKRIAEAESKANAKAVRIKCLEEENNQLKVDICNATMNLEHITEDNEAQAQTITNLLKTIESVQGVKSEYETFIGGMKSQIDKIKAEVRADTLQELRNRLIQCIGTYTNKSFVYVDAWFALIDQIVKEMVEGE